MNPVLTEEWIYQALNCGREDVASGQGGRLVGYLRKNLAYLESKRVGVDREKAADANGV